MNAAFGDLSHGIMEAMSENDDPVKVATVDTTGTPQLSPEAIAALDTLVPLFVQPGTLREGLRYLQQRIPAFEVLTVSEERSLARAAYLDPEIRAACTYALGAWDADSAAIFGWDAEHWRAEEDSARAWDDAEREIEVLLKGVHGANLRRRHTLGQAMLDFYSVARRSVRHAERAHLRPYVEEMQRAFVKARRKKTRKPE